MDDNTYRLGFCEILTLIFIVLKLCKVINWSWWLVFAPILVDVVVAVAIIIIYYILSD